MNLIDVTSSTVSQVAFNGRTRELLIIFNSGRTYAYSEVTEETFKEFLNADSKGTFFNRVIRKHASVELNGAQVDAWLGVTEKESGAMFRAFLPSLREAIRPNARVLVACW